MKFLLMILVILYANTSLFAQKRTPAQPPHHQFGVTATYTGGYWKDAIFSPLNYQVQGAMYQVNYQRENRKEDALFQAAINIATGQIAPVRSDLSYFTSDYIVGNITLGYLRLVPEKHDKIRLFAGPQYRLNVSYFDYSGQDSFSFVASHTLDAKALLQYSLGTGARHEISTGASLALIGLLVRPPYAGYNTQLLNNYEEHPMRLIIDGGKFASLHNYQLATWSTGYQFALTPHTSISMHYIFSYQRVQDRFHPFTQVLNQVGGGITLKL